MAESMAYSNDFRCECGRDELCNRVVLEQAARIDAMREAKAVAMRLKEEWETATSLVDRLKQDMTGLEARITHHQATIATNESVIPTSQGRENELRSELEAGAKLKSTEELCELIARIVDETRIRRGAEEEVENARRLHRTDAATLEELQESGQAMAIRMTSLRAQYSDHVASSGKLLDFL